MALSDRKLKILEAIIREYIESAEPVGSRSLSRRYELGVSPATIRNEMSDLEELGYIQQPHTSAGRIPSDKGYRLYVDKLMEIRKKANKNRVKIKSDILKKYGELEQLLEYTSRVLSEFTQYTSIVLAPQVKKSRLKQIQLARLNDEMMLAIFITNTGLIQNPIFKIPADMKQEDLERISNFLNEEFVGSTLEDIESKMAENLKKELAKFHHTVYALLPEMFKTLEQVSDVTLYLSGTTNIFNFPEFNDLSKARAFLNLMEERKTISELISRQDTSKFNVSIGSENKLQEARECSIVTTTYSLDQHAVGQLSVIGPTRMDYDRVISVLGQVSKMMNEILKSK
ncbi:heat-inducible transcription repressor HrcA [Tindallia magadiensis]|uniref:Heat-inducible transcription repressor HrcA n=1 Tax=Tindallia magadiensis TaxID=69895 RepID=A0A1I3B5L8_9FIRM|nr:heat-inducible transcriptional repressor HrcA [Tindallia magadiensis]SFH57573.1 heat-inducible transcription repressor HrcA [Tindallia magadiensis]